jgi:hypothetical protein
MWFGPPFHQTEQNLTYILKVPSLNLKQALSVLIVYLHVFLQPSAAHKVCSHMNISLKLFHVLSCRLVITVNSVSQAAPSHAQKAVYTPA